ncbi:UDP-N-acetylmuramoyl-tripeptide--D-alanyl-D-alanine ligase [Wolbachia endosymbiont (group B) of Ennomos erosarius]|uniref:UDP-N-acetylmuramoyl-tripeptide--D-alanyl-D- alanine ligase n=1 Tax=Wolbachia endosymbiont (group B) of Ennomos erosarius TaxID=3066175 RepID=UPI003132FE5C
MFKWNTNNIIDATGGRGEGGCYSSNISTDTRSIKKDDLFIALKGKNFDGHNFLHEAFLKGAAAAIVSEGKYKSFPLVIVQDTLKALHDMASYYIRNVLVDAKVIAITGSVGKTTTKDMLHTVLLQYGVSHANEGNLNNNIGLPLTILKAPKNCQYLILEMGMNKAGEIKELSKISNPNIAVITNIEPAHTENFSSLFDVAQAKLEILYGMKNNGTLILNRDNKYYDYLSSHANRNVISFGKDKNAEVCLLDLIRNDDGLNLKIRLSDNQTINCNLRVQGEHFACSLLVAAAVVQSLGLDLSKLPLALKNFSVTKGRGNIHKVKYNKKYIHLIDDSYNASPTSMKTAIKTLSTYSNQRKVALLGDMLELGDKSIEFHTDLVKIITENNIDKVYTVGKSMLELHELLPDNIRGAHFNDSNQLKSDLANIIQNNDAILVKGSQGMKMDLIVREFIIEY